MFVVGGLYDVVCGRWCMIHECMSALCMLYAEWS
jgi:hypothetical protein